MNALEIRDLTKTYGNGVKALKGVSLTVAPGDFYALLGPNGAGKSTTIGIICSLVRKGGGDVSIYGVDIDTHPAEARKHIGLVPQEHNFNIFVPVQEILINQAGYFGIPRKIAKVRAEKYLRQLELWDWRHVMARELSGGMKRRMMIARALMHEPKLIILDEPTAGVDIEIRRSMWQFMREINAHGTTIILTTHYLEEAENLCNNIAIIDKGITIEETSMRDLLDRLNTESFLLYLERPIATLPDCGDYDIRKIDSNTLEVDLHKGQRMSHVFAKLSTCSIEVASMRNKSNRLEQLFLDLLKTNGKSA